MKDWKHNPGDSVSWTQTHGARSVLSGVVIAKLPRFEKHPGNTKYYTTCENLVVEARSVLKGDCPKPEAVTKELSKVFLKTKFDRYLIWVPSLKEFRTPGKKLVERGA